MNVRAGLDFVEASPVRPAYIMQEYGKQSIRRGKYTTCEVEINDGRVGGPFSLDKNGFTFLNVPSPISNLEDADRVNSIYYDHVKQIISQETGASIVYIIDHTIRSSKLTRGIRGVANHVHNDYTEKSGLEVLRNHIGVAEAEATQAAGKRIMQVNVWRPLTEPVIVAPLAIADGSTVPFTDLVPCDIVYPSRVGEIYELMYSPKHKWFYFPMMSRDEIILIKGYDSLTNNTVRFAPHSAFNHPQSKSTDPIRMSLEVRTLAII